MKDAKGNLRLVDDFSRNGTPEQFRWMPPKMAPEDKDSKVDFVDGLFHVCGAGNTQMKSGLGIMMYVCNTDMTRRAMCSSDGDMLIVPQQGTIRIQTEMGWLQVQPTEICVIPRGIKFSVFVTPAQDQKEEDHRETPEFFRGYIAEVHHGHFVIPDLGPIGSNGLANPRDFEYPVACFVDEEDEVPFELVHKYQNKLFTAHMIHTVFNVVAWHGNFAPFKYDLKKFNTINTVSYDHPDPCIYTVLTCQTEQPGTAVLDFVIFPPRWTVAEHTFRPPYYHRNTMNEYMGLIYGGYEAKEKGFMPGGSSLHNCMAAHGPESEVTYKSEQAELKPSRIADSSMAFMFESVYMLNPTDYALARLEKDEDYLAHWNDVKRRFNMKDVPKDQ